MIVFAVLVAALLSQRFVRKIFHPVIQPDASWLFRKEALRAAAAP
jgi:hypothetical protein